MADPEMMHMGRMLSSVKAKFSLAYRFTTELPFFAECQLHSANACLHSAKALQSVTLDKEHSTKSLPRADYTRQICHVGTAGDGAFAECGPIGTRQR